MNPWVTVLVSAVTALLGGGALAVLIGAVAGKKPRRAEVADRLSDSTLKWVEQFQEEAADARREAADTRREVADARREIAEVRRELAVVRAEAEALAVRLRGLVTSILAPGVTVEQLRDLVTPDSDRITPKEG